MVRGAAVRGPPGVRVRPLPADVADVADDRVRQSAGAPLHLAVLGVVEQRAVTDRVPTVTVERRVNVAPVALARKLFAHPPSWVLLFTKAYAVVA